MVIFHIATFKLTEITNLGGVTVKGGETDIWGLPNNLSIILYQKRNAFHIIDLVSVA